MLSALKKLTSRAESTHTLPSVERGGAQTMSANLQRKFAHGINYNMKLIIKGDRNVGKTCLWLRLQGKPFFEPYNPTDEIQVASIHWNYKATDDIVKVEVWDVVDKAKKKRPLDGLKFDYKQPEVIPEMALDAECVNVYKGASGVILVFDITKPWTFEYVVRELPNVPVHLPVLVLANHCDMAHHRQVSREKIAHFVENCTRGDGGEIGELRWAESSMRNSFGLKLLHKFLNLPYLQLQRHSLLLQLERNLTERQATLRELDLFLEGDEADYDKFLDKLATKRREQAEGAKLPVSVSMPFVPSNSQGSVVVPSKSLPSLPKDVNNKTISSPRRTMNVDEFVPEEPVLDTSFLEDVDETDVTAADKGDSEDEIRGNPLVSGFQDDIDPEDTTFRPIKPPEKNWLVDSQLRRSPEGGEDSRVDRSPKPAEKREKKKREKKTKKKKTKEKERDELEDFLNGPSSAVADHAAYEAF